MAQKLLEWNMKVSLNSLDKVFAVFFLAWCIGENSVWAISENELWLRAMEDKIASMGSKSGGKSPKVAYDGHGVKKQRNIKVGYSRKGFGFKTSDGLFSTNLQWRAQMRFANPEDGDPITESKMTADETNNFELRRVRMKIGGHGYKKIKYYFEVELQPSRTTSKDKTESSSRLIDWRISYQPYDEFGFEVGQRKIQYNRERVDSSGRQQFVERSIVNSIFTIDRQVGITFRGRFNRGTIADFRYYAGVYNGEGLAVDNDDDNMMYMARVQWNMFGSDLKWRQSDVKYHKKPTGSLSYSVASNEGTFTKWSSSGGGSLSGFSSSNKNKVNQWTQGSAFKYRGLSWQQEYHEKYIEVNNSGIDREFEGGYAQVGYMLSNFGGPEGLELAYRYAWVDEPDSNDLSLITERTENTLCLNYFIAGHNNKITLDSTISGLEDGSSGADLDDFRVRLQWDISF